MTIPASAPRYFTISATPGVLTMSRSTTAIPDAVNAATAASRTIAPDGLESRPTTTTNAFPSAGVPLRFNHAANPAAYCDATPGVKLVPTIPRSPETPIINGSELFMQSILNTRAERSSD